MTMYTLGIDVGTTGTKAYVLDEKGLICGKGYKAYGLEFGEGGYVTQNPNDWWDACVKAVREATRSIADKQDIKALSLSTQGGSSFVASEDGNPLMEAMTWMDARAIVEAKILETSCGFDFFYRSTGWKLNASMDAAKYLWLKNNAKTLLNPSNRFVSTLEFLNKKLTGTYIIDPTNAAMRQLFNIEAQAWDAKILDLLEINDAFLPEVKPSGAPLGKLTATAALELGLHKDTQVFNGAHDQYCAAIGAGAIHKGKLLLSTGTAWVLLLINDKPLFTDTYVSPGPHVLNGLFGLMSTLPVAGVSLDWFKKGFTTEDYAHIDSVCMTRNSNTKGLYFYPYFNGATFPLWQSSAKATIVGLSLEHDRFDVARAIMEGVVFQMRIALENYKKHGCDVSQILLMGGALKSDIWTSLIANITKCKIKKVTHVDSACIGAAIMAGVSSGIYDSYESILAKMASLEDMDFDLTDADYYDDKFDKYQNNWSDISKVYES